MPFSLPLGITIWYNTNMNSKTTNNSKSGDYMNITSYVFISQNGMQQVELNFDDQGRADVQHRQFNQDGVEYNIFKKYPTRKPISEVKEYIKKLKEDYRYIDVSCFDEQEQDEWREIQLTAKDRAWVSNPGTGSAWRAMGAGIKPKSFEDFYGCTPEEYYYG